MKSVYMTIPIITVLDLLDGNLELGKTSLD